MMKPPCQTNCIDCPKRHPGCQTNCEKLVPLHEHYRKIRETLRQEDIYKGYIVPVIEKNRYK